MLIDNSLTRKLVMWQFSCKEPVMDSNSSTSFLRCSQTVKLKWKNKGHLSSECAPLRWLAMPRLLCLATVGIMASIHINPALPIITCCCRIQLPPSSCFSRSELRPAPFEPTSPPARRAWCVGFVCFTPHTAGACFSSSLHHQDVAGDLASDVHHVSEALSLPCVTALPTDKHFPPQILCRGNVSGTSFAC